LKPKFDFARKLLSAAFVVLLLTSFGLGQYVRTDLVANQPGVALHADPNLRNGWGLVSTASSPYWVSDNDSGFSTLYQASGQVVSLVVSIPPATGSPARTLGTPTGIVANISPNATDFVVSENGKSGKAAFIFATLDGTISGWNFVVGAGPGGNGGNSHATLAADRSGVGASYSGLAIGSNNGEFLLYAADDGPNRRIDVFDSNFHLVTLSPDAFSDPQIPNTFAPYGIQNIDGDIWVTYTALNKGQGGFVDHFGPDGVLKMHGAAHGPLHSPWGLAKAPPDFGPLSNAILVSNNTARGRINAFDPNTGEFIGPMLDTNGVPIEVEQIWAIQFGRDKPANGNHNQLFFTAGPSEYANGGFGMIALAPQ
jgi:uncharacterized protein (TIGR03118 family)